MHRHRGRARVLHEDGAAVAAGGAAVAAGDGGGTAAGGGGRLDVHAGPGRQPHLPAVGAGGSRAGDVDSRQLLGVDLRLSAGRDGQYHAALAGQGAALVGRGRGGAGGWGGGGGRRGWGSGSGRGCRCRCGRGGDGGGGRGRRGGGGDARHRLGSGRGRLLAAAGHQRQGARQGEQGVGRGPHERPPPVWHRGEADAPAARPPAPFVQYNVAGAMLVAVGGKGR